MEKINRAICIVAIAVAGCNSNMHTNNSVSQTDSAIVTNSTSNVGTTSSAQSNPAKVDNLSCPVCRKQLVTCSDTTTYQDKLIGFDSRQCYNDFLLNPPKYPIKYK